MTMYLELFLLSIIIVIITDLTSWPSTCYKVISSLLTKGKIITTEGNLTILTCSLCQTFWTGLIYLIVQHELSIMNLTYVVGLALMTDVFKSTILLIKDLINKLINVIYERIE